MGQWLVRAASLVAVVSLGLAGKWAVGCASGESDSAPVGQVRAALVLDDAGPGAPLVQTATAQRLSDRISQRCQLAATPTDAGVGDAGADGAAALAKIDAFDAGSPSLPGMPTPSELATLVTEAGTPTSFTLTGNTVTPAAKSDRGRPAPQIGFGASAGSGFAIGDPRSSMRLRVTVDGLADVAAEAASDRVAYPEVSPGVGWALAASASGIEDTFQFESGPSREDVLYHVALENVAGLRLIEQTLEFLDSAGAPRLRMSVPSVLDADCNRVATTISVQGCGVSTDPSPPWGKPVVPPGPASCDVRLSWAGKGTKYPLCCVPADWRDS